MDVKREGVIEARRRKRLIYGVLLGIVIIFVSIQLWRLEPAPPTIPRSSVYTGKVERGEMLRQVRGPGTLVPTEIRWLPAVTEGRVERKVLLPGATVEPESIILQLSNPQLEQRTQDAELGLRAAQASYIDRKVDLNRQLLTERAAQARLESEHAQAVLQSQADQRLYDEGLKPELEYQLSQLIAQELEKRLEIEKERLDAYEESIEAQLNSESARLEQARKLYELRVSEREALEVRAGIRGVLQEVPVEVGQQVQPGTNLARVAQPDHLKAELRIAETQAKDIAFGQRSMIDTRNGVVEGKVTRIDPAVQNGSVTVDVELIGELPRGARPDLSVDGTIELERLVDVLYVGRPTYGQAESRISLFRLDAGENTATRVPVELGRTSVTTVEIRNGLAEGDEVILSDTSQWEDHDRVRLGS